MRSLVNWALLGLVIERPSYAYELAQRFEQTYGDALSLSSVSHVYTALGTLQDRALIEELPGTRTGRQPKPHYRATAQGLQDYHEWLIGQVAEEHKRQRVFFLQLTALMRDPGQAMKILEDYERAYLDEAAKDTPAGAGPDRTSNGASGLAARLVGDQERWAMGTRLSWIHHARRELKTFVARPERSPER